MFSGEFERKDFSSRYTRDGIFFILTGPSGVGKTTVIKKLVESDPKIRYSISHTTRGKRSGEEEGKDYYFISEEEFKRKRSRGEFLEWASVFDDYYGTSREELEEAFECGKDLVLDVDVQGARQIREKSSDERAAYIFLAPPSKRELMDRFESRNTESPEEKEKRMSVADREMEEVDKFDYLVVNEELEDTLDQIESIVIAERCRVASGK